MSVPFPVEPDLSPREASRLSGVSYWTVLEEIKRGRLIAYRRPGGKLAIRRDDFTAWAYGDRVQPHEVVSVPGPSARVSRRQTDATVAAIDEIRARKRAT